MLAYLRLTYDICEFRLAVMEKTNMTNKFWAQRIDVRELRAELRAMREDKRYANEVDEIDECLALLRGNRGRLNFVETGAWNSYTHIQAMMQIAGSACLRASALN